ncbi:hypothetical protein OG279_36895 (plasmid) [Streptomyces sp. NBC_01201]|uniref:hypothetical protein n=1 Tax=Streptomyces sp. NBC_01201 TaxID=2903770 RepID=UPI002E1547D0|nr:hypothetical protein OG279_36895 [Streptomyces sp. NBC_01201]
MIANIGVVVSALVSFGALVVSFAVYRHQVERARSLDARERRVEAAERLAARRQASIERQEALSQASMIDYRIVHADSALVDGLVRTSLTLTNRSNQPVSGLAAWVADERINDVSGTLEPGEQRAFYLSEECAAALRPDRSKLDFAFTDAADIRWRRDGTGGLREGAQTSTGDWIWKPREGPVVAATDLVRPLPAYPPASRRAPRVRYAGCLAVLFLLAAILSAIWYFIR